MILDGGLSPLISSTSVENSESVCINRNDTHVCSVEKYNLDLHQSSYHKLVKLCAICLALIILIAIPIPICAAIVLAIIKKVKKFSAANYLQFMSYCRELLALVSFPYLVFIGISILTINYVILMLGMYCTVQDTYSVTEIVFGSDTDGNVTCISHVINATKDSDAFLADTGHLKCNETMTLVDFYISSNLLVLPAFGFGLGVSLVLFISSYCCLSKHEDWTERFSFYSMICTVIHLLHLGGFIVYSLIQYWINFDFWIAFAIGTGGSACLLFISLLIIFLHYISADYKCSCRTTVAGDQDYLDLPHRERLANIAFTGAPMIPGNHSASEDGEHAIDIDPPQL